ncbi:hypothetical protein V5O48_010893, partial [Marasmius crinis-equi]
MVDPRAPQSLHQLIAKAKSTYRSPRMAINRLQRLGHPLATHKITVVFDGPADIVLHVIAALQSSFNGPRSVATSALEQVRLHWGALSSWIQHLLEALVLSEDGPLSPEALIAFEHILILLPSLLNSPVVMGEIDVTFLYHRSPLLLQLIVRTWFKTLDIHHWTYGLWSLVLIRLASSSSSTSWFIPDSADHHATQQQGLTFVQHLNEQLKLIPTMSLDDYREFLAFLCCPALEESRPFCPVAHERTIPALVKLLAVVTRRRRQVRSADANTDEYAITMGVTFQILSYLSSFVREPYFATEALNSGLLDVLLRAPPCFLRIDDPVIPLVRRFYYLAAEIIDRVAGL